MDRRTVVLLGVQTIGALVVVLAVSQIATGWHGLVVVGLGLIYGAHYHLVGRNDVPGL